MIWWTGLAPWEFEFSFSGSLTSTFLRAGLFAISIESAMVAAGSRFVFRATLFSVKYYLTESVYGVILQKSVHTQIHQRALYISNNEEYVDGFVRNLTCAHASCSAPLSSPSGSMR